jgi:hypothetical protein
MILGKAWILSSLCSEPKATVRLEGLGQLKTPMTSLRIETATFQLKT